MHTQIELRIYWRGTSIPAVGHKPRLVGQVLSKPLRRLHTMTKARANTACTDTLVKIIQVLMRHIVSIGAVIGELTSVS